MLWYHACPCVTCSRVVSLCPTHVTCPHVIVSRVSPSHCVTRVPMSLRHTCPHVVLWCHACHCVTCSCVMSLCYMHVTCPHVIVMCVPITVPRVFPCRVTCVLRVPMSLRRVSPCHVVVSRMCQMNSCHSITCVPMSLGHTCVTCPPANVSRVSPSLCHVCSHVAV